MAIKVAVTNGNWSTAGTWESVTNTPTIHASTNVAPSSGGAYTATFTAPNTTNACTGVLIYAPSYKPGVVNITATLQENSINTAATVTINNADIPSIFGWIYFRFPTPYVFTSTTAGYYRFQIKYSGGTSAAVAADSSGSLIAFLATDDRTGAPATTDDVFIIGANQTGSVLVTIDGTQTIGSGADTALASPRSVGCAIQISTGGDLEADITATSAITVKGHIVANNGGKYGVGSVATPLDAAYTHTFKFNENGTACNYGGYFFNTSSNIMQGTPKPSTTAYYTKYASGVGTAADPLITADNVGWTVNDEIIIGPTGAAGYNHTEYRFIKTVNADNSYVLSSTVGGAEAALTYTHTTDAHIVNVERNIIIGTTNNAVTDAMYWNLAITTAGNSNVQWVRFENTGRQTTSKQGVYFVKDSVSSTTTFNYNVAYRWFCEGFTCTTSSVTETYSGLIMVAGSTSNSDNTSGFITQTVTNKTFTNIWCFDGYRDTFNASNSVNCIYNNVYSYGATIGGNVASGAIDLSSTILCTFNNCEFECGRNQGMYLQGCSTTTFKNCDFGSYGTNTLDILCNTGKLNDILFDNCTFTSATLISRYLLTAPGTQIKFKNFNSVTNKHFWYTNAGSAQATGTGLTDTTVKTSGSLGLRINPEDNTNGFNWQFNIPCPAGSIISFFCWAQKNTAFGMSTAKFELFLPGNSPDTGTADASYTMSNSTGVWEAISISANNTNTIDLLGTIKVTGITATAGAYLYVDTLYNADTTQKLTGLDIWDRGMPATLILPTAVSAADIWTFSTTNLTTTNTTGNKLNLIPLSSVIIDGEILA